MLKETSTLARWGLFCLLVGMKILVRGGGIAGLVSAWALAKVGHGVVVHEVEKLGAGASGKALGVLVPVEGLDRPIDKVQRQGIGMWPVLAEDLATVSGWDLKDFWRVWGNGRYQVRIPAIFEVFKAAIAAKGGRVMVGAAPEGDWDAVVDARGIAGAKVVGTMHVSAGVAGRFKGELDRLVAADNLFVVPGWEGEILAGSVNWRMDLVGDGVVPQEKLEELRERVERLVPGLELVEAWVGYRAVQEPRLPLVRRVGNDLVVAGLGKVGYGVAPVVGEIVVELVEN
jgi:glycine/D-amino acid oxidase-like deaminating enzyme